MLNIIEKINHDLQQGRVSLIVNSKLKRGKEDHQL